MDTVDIKRLIYTASILLMSYLLVQLYITIDQRPKIESVNYDSIQIPVINALSQSQPKASNNQAFDYKIIGTRIGVYGCLLYTSPSPRDRQKSRMPSSA